MDAGRARQDPPSLAGWLAALALAAMTGAVFGSLQNVGPESTIRKLNRSLGIVGPGMVSVDRAEVQPLLVQDLDDPIVGSVLNRVAVLATGSNYVAGQRHPLRSGQIVVEGAYLRASGHYAPFVWVLMRSGRVWKVDAHSTWNVMAGRPIAVR
ncbi:MAG: hypothetical protein KIS66_05585 [Fimbriimonadaceae bacterium]|nr:hypothetical protein [Fimbriimonadaceae bacterium]